MHKRINFITTLVMFISFYTIATEHKVRIPKDYKQVGQAEFSWLWFDIYHATLLTPTGKYQFGSLPFVLQLTYARQINHQQLVESTEEDWQRQQIDYSQKWLKRLNTIWPDVFEGDVIRLYIDSQSQSHFFYNSVYRGTIGGKAFAHAISSIWLSDHTREPALRNKLIGHKE